MKLINNIFSFVFVTLVTAILFIILFILNLIDKDALSEDF
jgi:hypothetical protein